MGVSYIYKKFRPEDKAIIPFNAHKQYNYDSSAASNNQVTYYHTNYTSESVSLYSSASSVYGGDTINNIKYNQIDHLFYRDHLKKFGTKKDPIHYLRQKKELYKTANILSIPSGLYGFEIKKSSFYLSSSQYEMVDDSLGNLHLRNADLTYYITDPQINVFKLGPIKGFKKYDLAVHDDYAIVEGREYVGDDFQYIHKQFYRGGQKDPTAASTYTSDNNRYPKGYYSKDEDDSYFFNELYYHNVTFQETVSASFEGAFSDVSFNSNTSSYISSPHNSKFNFNTDNDFTISFYMQPIVTASNNAFPIPNSTEKRYIMSKSTTKTVVTDRTTLGSGSRFLDVAAEPQYPFEIYLISNSLSFEVSDGYNTNKVSYSIPGDCYGKYHHVVCSKNTDSDRLELYVNGTSVGTTTYSIKGKINNNANLYIGSKGKPNDTMKDLEDGGISPNKTFNGLINNINIFSKRIESIIEVQNLSSSINGSPYVGNIFYQSGFATITHPKYITALSGADGMGIINRLQFQGSHLIYEHEYQCTIQEHEFNNTTNTSVMKSTGTNPYELEGFTSSSFFKPYITTIGLYNEAYELLAIGKLGQPIRCSDETDTTLIIRYDT